MPIANPGQNPKANKSRYTILPILSQFLGHTYSLQISVRMCREVTSALENTKKGQFTNVKGLFPIYSTSFSIVLMKAWGPVSFRFPKGRANLLVIWKNCRTDISSPIT